METKILSVEEIAAIEEETEKSFGISRLILMENAGRLVAEYLNNCFVNIEQRSVVVFSGKGNNGGDGFVAARYLFNMGAYVTVFYLGTPDRFTEISFTNFQILVKMNIPVYPIEHIAIKDINLEKFGIIVDAIFGSGIKGEIKGKPAELIIKINEMRNFVVCADIPSGLNPNTGEVSGVAVKGHMTVSFGFAKKGFYVGKGPEHCGDIKIVDIGFPRFYYYKT